jgi:hypothetical protein
MIGVDIMMSDGWWFSHWSDKRNGYTYVRARWSHDTRQYIFHDFLLILLAYIIDWKVHEKDHKGE